MPLAIARPNPSRRRSPRRRWRFEASCATLTRACGATSPASGRGGKARPSVKRSRITRTFGANNRNRDMGYDGLDRLLVADAPNQWGTASYTYDSLDNLKSADQGTRQYRYNYDASNRLSQIKTPAGANVFTFGYDVYGNVTAKGAQAYAFDIANRLTAVTGLQSYRYDGQGRRVQTTDADNVTKELWVYSQSGQVLYTSEARRSQNLSYYYLGNTQVATRAVAFTTGTVTVRLEYTDALGSPVVETDGSGVVKNRFAYTPWGENSTIDGTGYTGHVMDQATGLIYMQQRYYDPQVGRFLSVDPMAVNTTSAYNFNRFAYAADNPYKFNDPDGRDFKTWFGTHIMGVKPNSENTASREVAREVVGVDKSQHSKPESPHETAERLDKVAMSADVAAIASVECPPASAVAEATSVSASVGAFRAEPTVGRAANVVLVIPGTKTLAHFVEKIAGKTEANFVNATKVTNEAINKATEPEPKQ